MKELPKNNKNWEIISTNKLNKLIDSGEIVNYIKGYKLKELKRTCETNPSQWEGKLNDGRMLYIRYRWSILDVRISKKPTNDIFDAVNGENIYYQNINNNDYDGDMTNKEMLLNLKHLFSFDIKKIK
jgi:hypothetical protein